jgi:hypothetical protein
MPAGVGYFAISVNFPVPVLTKKAAMSPLGSPALGKGSETYKQADVDENGNRA